MPPCAKEKPWTVSRPLILWLLIKAYPNANFLGGLQPGRMKGFAGDPHRHQKGSAAVHYASP